jgi:hypothetical protein
MEEYKEAENPEQERNKRDELLRRFLVSATKIDGFEGKTAEEIFNTENEQGRRELIEKLSSDGYCDLITGVNGILRGKVKEEWCMDGVGVTAAGHEARGAHIFPNHKDKKEIIVKSWEGAQEMNAEQRDLEDIGMLLGSLLVEAHPFGDGNGRTSRFVYIMLKMGLSEEEIEKVLGEYGREELDMALSKTFIDPLFEKKYGRLNQGINKLNIAGIFAHDDIYASSRYGSLRFPEGVSEQTRMDIIQGGRNDDNILVSAVLHFLNIHPEIDVESSIKSYGENRIEILQNLLLLLSKEQVDKLASTYWDLKKQYTEDIIDIFVHPDKPEYKVERDGKEIRMLDYFKQRIDHKRMLY